jgi:hypothetical protein
MGTCVFIISIIYTNNKLLLKVSWNINNKSLKMANGSPEAVNQTIQCSKDKVKNDKQWVTKHYKENKKIEHHNTRCRRHYGSKVNRSKKRHCICKHIETIHKSFSFLANKFMKISLSDDIRITATINTFVSICLQMQWRFLLRLTFEP